MAVGKGPDAQTVGGVELGEQEVRTGLRDVVQLEQTGGWQQQLHVFLRHGYRLAVDVVDQKLQCQGVDAVEQNFALTTFGHVGAKHGLFVIKAIFETRDI